MKRILVLLSLFGAAQAQDLTNGLLLSYSFVGSVSNQAPSIPEFGTQATLDSGAYPVPDSLAVWFGSVSVSVVKPGPFPTPALSPPYTISIHVYEVPYEVGFKAFQPASYITTGSTMLLGHVNAGQNSDGFYGAPVGSVSFWNEVAPCNSGTTFNRWAHYILLVETNVESLFMDGTNVGGVKISTPHPTRAVTLGTGIGYFKNFKVYNRLLSEAEIRELFANEPDPPGPRVPSAPQRIAKGLVWILEPGVAYWCSWSTNLVSLVTNRYYSEVELEWGGSTRGPGLVIASNLPSEFLKVVARPCTGMASPSDFGDTGSYTNCGCNQPP